MTSKEKLSVYRETLINTELSQQYSSKQNKLQRQHEIYGQVIVKSSQQSCLETTQR